MTNDGRRAAISTRGIDRALRNDAGRRGGAQEAGQRDACSLSLEQSGHTVSGSQGTSGTAEAAMPEQFSRTFEL